MIKILKNRKSKKELKLENARLTKTIRAKNIENENLRKDNEDLNIKINNINDDLTKSLLENKRIEKLLSKKANELSRVEKLLEIEIEKNVIHQKDKADLYNKIKQLQGTKGGLTKQNNILSKTNIELKKQLEESMSNKYLVKKIPSGRMPKGEKIRIKRGNHNSQVQKILNEKTNIEEIEE